METEDEMLVNYLVGKDGEWTAVAVADGEVIACMFCRIDGTDKQLCIERHTPRLSPRAQMDQTGVELIRFALKQASQEGLQRVVMSFHGFADEVAPLSRVYRELGFSGQLRWEMVSHQLAMDPGPKHLRYRSAGEIGLSAFYQIAGEIRDRTAQEVERSMEFSRKMWSVEPERDWLVAYEDENPVGIVQTAVTREGVGVLDHIAIVKEHRGRGVSRGLLARGLSALVARTDVVWLDVDEDNLSAARLYRRAGFQVHHHFGEVTRDIQ